MNKSLDLGTLWKLKRRQKSCEVLLHGLMISVWELTRWSIVRDSPIVLRSNT